MTLLANLVGIAAAVICSGPAHLLCYSSLMGTQLYQTFVITKVTFTSLPRPAFVRLQGNLWPIYFRIQSALLLATIVTLPPSGPLSLLRNRGDWIPLVIALGSALLNLTIFGPKTRQAMFDRHHSGATHDSKMGDKEQQDTIIHGLKRFFTKQHVAAIHLNLICIVGSLWHGWNLARRLEF